MTYEPNTHDGLTGALITIDYPHHEVHDGSFYICSDISGSVSSKIWRITTPNTTMRAHFTLMVSSDQAITLGFYENPTLNAAGTQLTAYNADRNSANTATVTAFKDTTTTSDGTLLFTTVTGSSNAKSQVGGAARAGSEYILKQNEDYLIKCTLANAGYVSIILDWYEE